MADTGAVFAGAIAEGLAGVIGGEEMGGEREGFVVEALGIDCDVMVFDAGFDVGAGG